MMRPRPPRPLAAFLLAALAALPLAGCLDGPQRSGEFSKTCPQWVPGLGGQQVTTLFSPNDPTDNGAVDFSAGNATRPARPLTSNSPTYELGGRTLTQDRLELDFTSLKRADGTWTFRGVSVQDGELRLRFTHARDGRALVAYDTSERDAAGHLVPREEFTFRGVRSNFTIQVPLDAAGGSPDPAGAFAAWTLTRDLDANPNTASAAGYSYELKGLFDSCE